MDTCWAFLAPVGALWGLAAGTSFVFLLLRGCALVRRTGAALFKESCVTDD